MFFKKTLINRKRSYKNNNLKDYKEFKNKMKYK